MPVEQQLPISLPNPAPGNHISISWFYDLDDLR